MSGLLLWVQESRALLFSEPWPDLRDVHTEADGSRDFPGLCTRCLAAHLSSPPLRDLQARVPLWAASRMASSIRNEAFVFQNGPYAFPVCKGGAWWGLFFNSSLLFHSCLSPQGVFVGKAPRRSFLSISLFPPHFRRF